MDWNTASDRSDDYNCVGFAVGDNRWWESTTGIDGLPWDPRQYWPAGIPKADNDNPELEVYLQAIATVGYRECEHGEWEDGYRKMAIFFVRKDGMRVFKHAVLLEAKGRWKSKWGEHSDFFHELAEVHGPFFGRECVYLKRGADHDDKAKAQAGTRAGETSH